MWLRYVNHKKLKITPYWDKPYHYLPLKTVRTCTPKSIRLWKNILIVLRLNGPLIMVSGRSRNTCSYWTCSIINSAKCFNIHCHHTMVSSCVALAMIAIIKLITRKLMEEALVMNFKKNYHISMTKTVRTVLNIRLSRKTAWHTYSESSKQWTLLGPSKFWHKQCYC